MRAFGTWKRQEQRKPLIAISCWPSSGCKLEELPHGYPRTSTADIEDGRVAHGGTTALYDA
jgi:hypothetical protein